MICQILKFLKKIFDKWVFEYWIFQHVMNINNENAIYITHVEISSFFII
jgi:hypothetical protein